MQSLGEMQMPSGLPEGISSIIAGAPDKALSQLAGVPLSGLPAFPGGAQSLFKEIAARAADAQGVLQSGGLQEALGQALPLPSAIPAADASLLMTF
jgi:hypothetical protein